MLHIACATDDGVHFSSHHFGDAQRYLVFAIDLDTGDATEQAGFSNIPFTEAHHGDKNKAQHMAAQLKSNKIQALAAWAIGQNIQRMRRKFVPVISRIKNIKAAMQALDFKAVALEAAKPEGEARGLVKINSENAPAEG